MHTHPHGPDDLSDVERRLAACAPAAAGLDADAMLFAAGRASVRPGPARFAWPALTACLAALAAVLAVGWTHERSDRLALSTRLRHSPPAPAPAVPAEPPTADEPAPDSWLTARHALEQGLVDDWPAAPGDRPGPPTPDAPVLHWGRPASLPDL